MQGSAGGNDLAPVSHPLLDRRARQRPLGSPPLNDPRPIIRPTQAVEADGSFDDEWRSTGIEYSVTLDSAASAEDLERLSAVVDEVAEIPRAVRAGAPVRRRG